MPDGRDAIRMMHLSPDFLQIVLSLDVLRTPLVTTTISHFQCQCQFDVCLAAGCGGAPPPSPLFLYPHEQEKGMMLVEGKRVVSDIPLG